MYVPMYLVTITIRIGHNIVAKPDRGNQISFVDLSLSKPGKLSWDMWAGWLACVEPIGKGIPIGKVFFWHPCPAPDAHEEKGKGLRE